MLGRPPFFFSTGFKKTLFEAALKAKIADLETRCGYAPIWDMLVFNKTKAQREGAYSHAVWHAQKIRNGQSTVGGPKNGPKWSSLGQNGPKWTILVHFGLVSAKIQFRF